MTWKQETPPEMTEIISRWNIPVSQDTKTEHRDPPSSSPESNLAIAIISQALDEANGKTSPVTLKQDQISITAKSFLSGRSGNLGMWLEIAGVRDPGYFSKILKRKYK